MKRNALLFLTAVISLSVFSCTAPSADENIPTDSHDITEAASLFTTEELQSTLSQYTVIRPDDAEAEEVAAAIAVKNTYSLSIDNDWVKKGDPVPQDKVEILIGNTNRQATADALTLLRADRENYFNDYIIKFTPGKIVILGGTPKATVEAATAFVEAVLPKLGQESMEQFEYIYRKEYCMVKIGKTDISSYSILTSEEPTPGLMDAVNWLQSTISDRTGYTLPIVTKKASESDPVISVLVRGTNALEGSVTLNNKDLEVCGGSFIAAVAAIQDLGNMITEKTAITAADNFTAEYPTNPDIEFPVNVGIPNVLENPSDHRPVPTEFARSSAIDDLEYYPMPAPASEAAASLSGGVKLFGNEAMFDGTVKIRGDGEYGTIDIVPVKDQSFTRAVRLNMTSVPDKGFKFAYRFWVDIEDLYQDGDVMLAKFMVRRISGGDFDTQNAVFPLTFAETTNTKSKGGSSVQVIVGSEWTEFYMPIYPTHEYCEAGCYFGISAGSFVQEVEIGGFELIYYGDKYTAEDMPSAYAAYEGYEPDAQWRKDALAKIEEVRKGDITITVLDSDGKAVSGADIKLDMYEHEVNFAGAVAAPRMMDGKQAYLNAVVENFNSMATEGGFHRYYENQDDQKEYDDVERVCNWAYLNGCGQNVKGHALMWDKALSEGDVAGQEVAQSVIGIYLDVMRDADALNAKVRAHFEWMQKKFPTVTDWDVTNEDAARRLTPSLNTVKNIHGDDILIAWYQAAAEIFPNSVRELSNGFNDAQVFIKHHKPFMDWAAENLDFNGIGYHGHISNTTTPEDIIQVLDILEDYGKPIRITEFDSGNITEDQNYQANIVRDALIAFFSCEAVDTIQLWSIWDSSSTKKSNNILYNNNWTLKPSGEVYQDLVYNKWWTREAGETDQNGCYSTRGYYGDYTVTVTKGDKTVQVDVPCHKGEDNTVTVVLP